MTCEKHWEGVAGVKTLRMLLARKPSADTARRTMSGLSCTIAAGLTFKSLSFWFDHILIRGLYLDMLQVLTIPAVQNRRIYSRPTYDQWAVQKGRHFYNLARWRWKSSLVAEWLRVFMDVSDDTYGSDRQIGIFFVGCVCCVMMWVGHQS